jgi:hypothetical protein
MEAARGLNSSRKRSSIVKSTLVYFLTSKNVLESGQFFCSVSPVAPPRAENINDLRRFLLFLSTVFLKERFPHPVLTARMVKQFGRLRGRRMCAKNALSQNGTAVIRG